jgi:hypothetical protein
VRFSWSESWEAMIGVVEDPFGQGAVIEFGLGSMRRFPCIFEGEAQLLIHTTDALADGAARDAATTRLDITIERAWPRA